MIKCIQMYLLRDYSHGLPELENMNFSDLSIYRNSEFSRFLVDDRLRHIGLFLMIGGSINSPNTNCLWDIIVRNIFLMKLILFLYF